MTNESEENREPQSRGISATTIVVGLIGLLPAYVFSIGPVAAIWLKLQLATEPYLLFYAPLHWLYELDDSSWFARGLDWWVELWGGH